MAAQHQHYVPQLLLRGFLSRVGDEASKEQVRVFDLRARRAIPTPISIGGIMGERRYNDWWIDDEILATVEPACGRIESYVAPLVEKIRAERQIDRISQVRADLGLLMAFQFIRTKKMRLLPTRLHSQLTAAIKRMGFDPAKAIGLPPVDEENLKQAHARHQLSALEDYARIIAEKEFFLMTPPKGCSFYLGDHPVVMHNDEPQTVLTGRLGLGVPYIQIFLPLSAELLLCAWDPAVLGQMIKNEDTQMRQIRLEALSLLQAGMITRSQMKEMLEGVEAQSLTTSLLRTIRSGLPVAIGIEEVHFYNSLQALQAHRFVVDANADFEVAETVCSDRHEEN